MLLPVEDTKPLPVLSGQSNGKLSLSILVNRKSTFGGANIVMLDIASDAVFAMIDACFAEIGARLVPTSFYDSYRPLSVQQTIHDQRYDDQPTGNSRQNCSGKWWWLKTDPATGRPYATAACPGTSNHGWGRAIDFGQMLNGQIVGLSQKVVDWLCANAAKFGISAELQSENWHWRLYEDHRTPAVLAWLAAGGGDMALTDDDVAKIWGWKIGSPSLGDKPAQDFLKQGQVAAMEARDAHSAVTAMDADVDARLDAMDQKLNAILLALANGGSGGVPASGKGTFTFTSGA